MTLFLMVQKVDTKNGGINYNQSKRGNTRIRKIISVSNSVENRELEQNSSSNTVNCAHMHVCVYACRSVCVQVCMCTVTYTLRISE